MCSMDTNVSDCCSNFARYQESHSSPALGTKSELEARRRRSSRPADARRNMKGGMVANARTTNMSTAKKPSAINSRKIRNLTEELSREEYQLEMPLLDAAVAGVILGFKPSDREMRAQAQRCWETLKPQLNQHLLSEDETVLPWAEVEGALSPEVMNRIKKSHLEMRSLISKLNGVSFEEDPDKVVAVAGKALCMLAVKLDDLIDSEEMRLLPALRRMLFA